MLADCWCVDCSFTCHHQCRSQVTVECAHPNGEGISGGALRRPLQGALSSPAHVDNLGDSARREVHDTTTTATHQVRDSRGREVPDTGTRCLQEMAVEHPGGLPSLKETFAPLTSAGRSGASGAKQLTSVPIPIPPASHNPPPSPPAQPLFDPNVRVSRFSLPFRVHLRVYCCCVHLRIVELPGKRFGQDRTPSKYHL